MNKVKLSPSQSILAMDVGDVRIGLARAGAIARLPEPLETLTNDDSFIGLLKDVIKREDVGLIVVGLPRNLSGEETSQSAKIRSFIDRISPDVGLEFAFVDESLSSNRADEYIRNSKSATLSQDSIAACYILEEYLMSKEFMS